MYPSITAAYQPTYRENAIDDGEFEENGEQQEYPQEYPYQEEEEEEGRRNGMINQAPIGQEHGYDPLSRNGLSSDQRGQVLPFSSEQDMENGNMFMSSEIEYGGMMNPLPSPGVNNPTFLPPLPPPSSHYPFNQVTNKQPDKPSPSSLLYIDLGIDSTGEWLVEMEELREIEQFHDEEEMKSAMKEPRKSKRVDDEGDYEDILLNKGEEEDGEDGEDEELSEVGDTMRAIRNLRMACCEMIDMRSLRSLYAVEYEEGMKALMTLKQWLMVENDYINRAHFCARFDILYEWLLDMVEVMVLGTMSEETVEETLLSSALNILLLPFIPQCIEKQLPSRISSYHIDQLVRVCALGLLHDHLVTSHLHDAKRQELYQRILARYIQ